MFISLHICNMSLVFCSSVSFSASHAIKFYGPVLCCWMQSNFTRCCLQAVAYPCDGVCTLLWSFQACHIPGKTAHLHTM